MLFRSIEGREPPLVNEKFMQGLPTEMSMEHVRWAAENYLFPEGTMLSMRHEHSVMTADISPFFPISLEALDWGFRLPLSPLAREFVEHMGVNPGQLHLNVWRNLVTFIEIGRAHV